MRQGLVSVLAALVVTASIGALGVWAGQAWLVPSVGAAALVQVLTPDQPSAKPWNVLLGQLLGGVAGFIAVYVAGAITAAPFTSGQPLSWSRVGAAATAMLLTAAGQRALKAANPAGGAITLLVALGAVPPTVSGAALLLIGVLLVTALGEAARYVLLSAR